VQSAAPAESSLAISQDSPTKDRNAAVQRRWPDGSLYTGQLANGCMDGDGEKSWPDGRKYVGRWRQDMMWGAGKMTWPSGEAYEGQFRKNAFHGHGARTLPNGDRYEGDFVDGEQEGNGVFRDRADGWAYTGQWLHGRMYGQGRCDWPDGASYVGEWVDDIREGQGRLTWPDGSFYEGPFTANCVTGRGRKVFADGAHFEGGFVDGEFEGHGTFHWPDGTEFEGAWCKSGISGPGCHRFPGGTVIAGTFEEGGASGEGTKSWPNGCIYTGLLRSNRIDRSGTLKWPDGRCYVGSFEDDAMHGDGTLTWADASGACTYRGQFRWNEFEGSGVLEWSSGARYKGEFSSGLYHGQGAFEWPNKRSVYSGEWVHGEIWGKGHLTVHNEAGGSLIYEGEFKQGNMEGDGHIQFLAAPSAGSAVDSYQGEFRASRFNGRGAFTWSTGAQLGGLFEDGFCNRVGRKVYPDGMVYTGELRYDLEHGKGILSEPWGKKLVARWEDGKAVKELLASCAPLFDLVDTSLHEDHGNLLPDGRLGSVASRSDSPLSQEETDERCGTPPGGRCLLLPIRDEHGYLIDGKALVGFLNGDRYVGMMRQGRKHGHGGEGRVPSPCRGMYTYADLMTYKGNWVDDVLDGVRHPVTQDVLPVEVRRLHGGPQKAEGGRQKPCPRSARRPSVELTAEEQRACEDARERRAST